MQRITNKLHMHRKNRAAAPAQDTLVKPASAPLNAQGQPITAPLAPLPASIPLAAQPSTLGKSPNGLQSQQNTLLNQPLGQSPVLLQQPGAVLSQPLLGQQPILQQNLSQSAIPASIPLASQSALLNHQPVLSQQWQQGSTLQQGLSLQKQEFVGVQQTNLQTITRPPIVEQLVRPARIEQTARIEKVVEVQPIIHRNIDAPQVRIIEQHSYEAAPLVGPSVITNATIVEETIKPRIIEEVVPVIHRSVPAPVIQRVEQHIQEKVVQPTVNNKVIQQGSTNIIQGQARALPVQSAPTVMTQTAAPLTEVRTLPALVENTLRPEKVLEVQPIIHRNIDAPEVRVIEKHSFEQVRSTGPGVVYRAPLVQETVIPKIIEDIQPVIHREVPQVVLERQEQHLTENITQPTITTKQVVENKTLKALPVLPAQQRSFAKPLPAAPTVRSVTAAPIVESRTRAAVVEQTARQEIIQEIQPIIHREIDAPEVRVIEQHSYEKVASTGPSTVTLAPVIQETLHPKIIEEIQPVVHRSVPAPFIEHIEQHTTENITQPTVTTKQVLKDALVHTTTLQQTTFAAPVQAAPIAAPVQAAPIAAPVQAAPLAAPVQAAPLAGLSNTFASPLGTNLQSQNRIPVAPPLPPKGWSSHNKGLKQQSFASPMMGNNWSQQQGFAPLSNNIPPAPPMPTNLNLSGKRNNWAQQQQPVGWSAQQAGGKRLF